MADPPRFLNDKYPTFPDDNTSKEMFLQAEGQTYAGFGDLHVLLWWLNGATMEGHLVIQLVQLTGQAGNYAYYTPVAEIRSEASRVNNSQFLLGTFTRKQRDQILELAKNVKFQKTSIVNGYRVWTRDLLEAMVNLNLISREIFSHINSDIPLVRRRAEV